MSAHRGRVVAALITVLAALLLLLIMLQLTGTAQKDLVEPGVRASFSTASRSPVSADTATPAPTSSAHSPLGTPENPVSPPVEASPPVVGPQPVEPPEPVPADPDDYDDDDLDEGDT